MAGGTEEEKGIPVVYIRNNYRSGYVWFSLKHNDDVSTKPPICKCGAVEDLKSPVFSQPDIILSPSVAAVEQFIYVFGGKDTDNDYVDSAAVSYIDTSRPLDGWKVCKKQMSKARSCPYPVTLDDGRVLLLGGFFSDVIDWPFAQMFNPKDHEWVALESYPDNAPDKRSLMGHAIVKEGGETVVLMHGFGAPHLYTYNVSTDSWGTRWAGEFKTGCYSSALVNDIYYVLDVVSTCCETVVLCGYKVTSEQAECLPVEILVENDGKEWVPRPDRVDHRVPLARLLTCGGNKLGMIWSVPCIDAENISRFSYYWSIFEVTEDRTDGVLKLTAHPLSHVCYHVHNNATFLDALVPVGSNSV